MAGPSPRKGVAFNVGLVARRVGPPALTGWFAILPIHRLWRDAKDCAIEYGPDWERATARLRWRIIPGIY